MAIEEFIARKINPDGSTGTSKATIENHAVTYENSGTPSPYITEIKTLNGVSLVGSGNYDFDTALNEASTNAVQNKVITKFANDVAGTYVTKIELYEALKRGEVSSEVEKVYTNEINYIAENVMPSGKVTKILGKTEKSENLIGFDDINPTTLNGITYSVSNGVVSITGTASDDFNLNLYFKKNLPADSYSYNTFKNEVTSSVSMVLRGVSTLNVKNINAVGAINGTESFTSTDEANRWYVYIPSGVTVNFKFSPMIVKGSTAPTTFIPYYDGLKHTHITGLKSAGINLWDEEWEAGQINVGNGQNESSSNQIRSKNYIPIIPNATYYCHFGGYPTNVYGLVCYFYDTNKNHIGTMYNITNTTFTTPANAYFMRFCNNADAIHLTTYNHDICINISDVAINGNYYPYEEETLNVEADLNGVSTASDEINVEEGKKYQRFGIVDLGTLEYTYISSNGRSVFKTTSIKNLKKQVSTSQLIKAICALYNRSTQNTIWVDKDMAYYDAVGYNSIAFVNNDYTDANTFKQAMQGVILVYELETPVVTDVEIENDGWLSNLIKDGSITQQVDTDNLIAKEVDIAMNVVVDNQ
jgi:hypothetical protein